MIDELIEISDHGFAAIWNLSEDSAYLEQQISLSPEQLSAYCKIKVESKKAQWLAARILINHITGKENTILHNSFGKPYIEGDDINISISHSGKMAAVILSKTHKVGIDIEQISDRIKRISEKFLNKDELSDATVKPGPEKLHIYWGAKEAMYKIYGERELIFKEQLLVEPFVYKKNGKIAGKILTSDLELYVDIYYKQVTGYMLVYAIEK